MRISETIIGTALLLAASAAVAGAQAQSAPVVSHAATTAISPRLSALPTAHWVQTPQGLRMVPPPKPLAPRGAGPGGPNGGDRALQNQPGPQADIRPMTGFGGIGANGFIPPDPNIAVGKNDPVTGIGYVVQVVNSEVAVFDKSGKLVTGPVSLSSLWQPLGGVCAGSNAGDPIAQYDVLADRWLISQLGSTNGPTYSECIAVSQTNDPGGAYALYDFDFGTDLNDYPKFGVWPTATNSAYLASYNLFTNGSAPNGAKLCAYDRQAMLNADPTAAQICAAVPNDAGFLPADLDGATPPADGTPAYFLNFETTSSLRLYQLSPDFAAIPASATLTQATPDLSVAPFGEACGGGTCIAQPNQQKLDSLGDRLMYRLAYRVFPDHAAMVVNHSVTAGSSVGVRWYELRQSAAASAECDGFASGAFYLCQQGTFAPDAAYRWMGSAAMDGAGNIALGYSKSSSTVYPSIAFTGRTPGMAHGTMGAETVLQPGGGAQTTYSRWGDYTGLRIDPSDDTTFWYTNEYYSRNSRFLNYLWSTAIASFTVGANTVSPPDFTLSSSASRLTVTRGSSSSAAVAVTAVNGSSAVNLSISGLPKGSSASFKPNPVTATGNSQLTISASRSAPKGSFGLTITGSNGSSAHSLSFTLTVQ